MEASALPASVGLARTRIAIGAPLLRIRSDEQLVSLFRTGNDDAFRIIHDRYRTRLLAYSRQMLSGSSHDPEDALQEIFVRAYFGLRASQRTLALRPWLYRIAHNRCVDELRRPPVAVMDPTLRLVGDDQDPATRAEQRDALRKLIADVSRLPDQQRSALLMRELSGMSYRDVAAALGVSVPAVKSLLVRARLGLAAAGEARDTACSAIRAEVLVAHDRGVRTGALVRRHMHDCGACREFRAEIRGHSRQLAALAPTLGPLGVVANLLGWGSGGGAAGGGAAAAGGAVGGAATGGALAGTGAAAGGLLAGGAGHVVTLLAAAVVTAGGAVEIQHSLSAPAPRVAVHHGHSVRATARQRAGGPTSAPAGTAAGLPALAARSAAAGSAAQLEEGPLAPTHGTLGSALATRRRASRVMPLTERLDPDHLPIVVPPVQSTGTTNGPTGAGTSGTTSPGSGGPSGTAGSGTPSTPADGTAAGGTTPSTTATGSAGTSSGTPAGASTGQSSSGPSQPAPSGSSSSSATGATATGGGAGGTTGATSSSSTGASVGSSVHSGARSTGQVVSFIAPRRHGHHRFTLGTLLPR